ncbi:epimerase [Arthrobacter sp. MYb229]|uniref:DUF1304 domain-containing protein n=1 Tax=Micrococcaceae TaxID=1268 RepID=UPI000CFAA75C|nr:MULTISPECIES: DUF1304 domain-containing protein [unclassified Arthrobacter]PRA06849.1 epimerase [Arthrobacter sp. MYb229]PRB53751.1 epimerase [Arthrobacter sp. MYb216]
MVIIGLVLGALAAIIHVYIFLMESVWWTTPRARAIFGTSEAEAKATKELAFNQGFYNLFLGIAVLLGVVLFLMGQPVIAATLVLTGAGSMVLAATVLLISSPDKASAALKQGVLPLLAVIFMILGLAL